MTRRFRPRSHALTAAAHRQRGVAVVLLLGVLVGGAGYLLLRSLNAASPETERDRITREALMQAKEALVAYAVADQTRPGELPCPDVNDDGQLVMNEDFVGSNCVSLLGRLPWRTLDISDLRDGYGERLWYALSGDFRANGTVPLNSNTPGQINVVGATPITNAIALVIAPGAALRREGASSLQDRSGTGTCGSPHASTPKCNPVNYLDAAGGEDNADANTIFVTAAKSPSFNDRLLVVTRDDLMPPVEKRAAAELAIRLKEHFDAWKSRADLGTRGWYPWAAAFSTPGATKPGSAGTVEGLLPLSSSAIGWTGTVTPQGGGSGSGSCSPLPPPATAALSCAFSVTAGNPGFDIQASASNVATAFTAPPSGSSITVTTASVVTPLIGPTWNMNHASGTLTLDYRIRIETSGTTVLRIELPPSAWTTGSWLAQNDWHQVMFYALSPGYAVNGSESCGATPPLCVTVNNLASSGNRAAVVAAGSALSFQGARPGASVSSYLEGANQSLGDLIFEVNRRGSAFNDTVAVVRP